VDNGTVTDSAGSQSPNPDDDQRRRFREALERKKSRQAQGRVSHGPSSAVGPAEGGARQRTFRRKSG
jgi:hypothetical protein